jgi:hypothetical protein
MTLLMRVHGIECDPYDPEKFRLQLLGVDTGALSTLFLRVTREELAPYPWWTSQIRPYVDRPKPAIGRAPKR